MTKPWGIERLDQVAQVVGRGIAPKYDDDGDFLVVNQRCIRDGRVSLDIARRHNSGARKVKADKVLSAGDVLVNSTGVGTLGRTAPLRDVQSSITADSHVTILRPLPDISSRWFAYAVSALEPEIENLAEGSTGQTELSRHRLADLELTVPPLSEQRAIAATLGALDDKIESNRRIIGLIPRLVRAHVNSAISHSSTFISVSDLATFVNGGAYTKGATGTGRMVIRIAELNSGPGRSTVYNDIKVPDEKIARAGDILMSWSGSLGVYRWYRDEAIINQHIFKVSPTGYPAWLVFDRLDEVMSVFRRVAADKATTMGHIQRGHLISTNVEIPTQGALEELETKISPLWDRLLLAERENLDLEQLRDALLPELLSGRIHVTAEGAEA